MTENRMFEFLRSAGIDIVATLAVFALLIHKIVAWLSYFGFPVEWIPAAGAVAAALCGAFFGRVLDWSKDYYLSRRARRGIKKRSKYKLP